MFCTNTPCLSDIDRAVATPTTRDPALIALKCGFCMIYMANSVPSEQKESHLTACNYQDVRCHSSTSTNSPSSASTSIMMLSSYLPSLMQLLQIKYMLAHGDGTIVLSSFIEQHTRIIYIIIAIL